MLSKKWHLLASIIFFSTLICFIHPHGWAINIKDQKLKDAESATHGDEASTYQIVNTYKYSGYQLIQFNLAVLSHYSYLLVSENQAMVVDPGRDIFSYLDYAKKNNLKFMGVLLTHSHADFVAGHIEFLKGNGVKIYSSVKSGAEYKHQPVKEGDVIKLGQARIKIIETPGHTPDGVSAVVSTVGQESKPDLLLSGDTLFIGSVGRPDLMGGTMSAATLASMMYDSWTFKLAKLPDSVSIFPAHGAGSLCGAHLSDSPTSTIGAEKKSNPYLQYNNRSEFVAAILDGLPEAPQYFKHNASMNKKGPELVDWQKHPEMISANKSLMNTNEYFVIDLRLPNEYAASHIPNSVNIGLRGRLETWVGIMVPWTSKVVYVGNEAELKEASYRLNRVGYSGVAIKFEDWKKAGLLVKNNQLIKPQDLYARMKSQNGPTIVDVRLPSEWMGVRIGTIINLPINHLDELSQKLDKEKPTVAICNSAYRSSMALGVLERKGFKNITSLDGGGEAWIKAGLPVYGQSAHGKQADSSKKSLTAQRAITLPERISADELRRLIVDLPNSFDLIDIRADEYFRDYAIPGARNVDINEVISNPSFLVGVGPLILIDRDGTYAMAVGGILSQKTKRQIKVLYGGLESYWSSEQRKSSKDINSIRPMKVIDQSPSEVPMPLPDTKKTTTTKKSAGC
ncbi:MAG: MBL fold metallo-hydrolase [Oligoflexia bacterium]|nr:MBL fold metallo-hydrolase [Oligoflexia bacterium]